MGKNIVEKFFNSFFFTCFDEEIHENKYSWK